jgi:hypothetical protein
MEASPKKYAEVQDKIHEATGLKKMEYGFLMQNLLFLQGKLSELSAKTHKDLGDEVGSQIESDIARNFYLLSF